MSDEDIKNRIRIDRFSAGSLRAQHLPTGIVLTVTVPDMSVELQKELTDKVLKDCIETVKLMGFN